MAVYRALTDAVRDGVALGPGFPMRHLQYLFGSSVCHTHVKGAGPVTLRRGSSDAETFRQVFRRKEYDLSWRGQYPRVMAAYHDLLAAGATPLIVDAGANIGAASIWFARQFPRAQVVAVEPDPQNAALCRANTAHLPNITVVEAAIGARPGRVRLTNPEGEAWAVQTVRTAEAEGVPVRGMAELAPPGARLFIAKIDIEGFEEELFSANTEWIDEAAVLMIEPHDWLFPERRSSASFQKAMAERDFELLISGENLIYINGELPKPQAERSR